MFNTDKYCQSCDVILTDDNLGTNADESASHLYCRECFQLGRYTQPYMTYQDMVKKWNDRFKAQNLPWWRKYGLMIFYPLFLRSLARWRSHVVS